MKVKVWLALISIYIIWGATYLAIRFAVGTIPPFLMAATRNMTAGAILFGFSRLRGAARPTLDQWKAAGISGLFLLLGGNGLVTWAEQHVTSSVAALIVSSMPLWIVLVDAVRPKGVRPSLLMVIGVLIGFLGVLVLIDPFKSLGSGEPVDLIGAIALLMAALLWAIGSIFGRENYDRMPKQPLLGSGMQMLVGGAGLLAAGTISGEWGRLDLANVSAQSLTGLVYLILFGSIVAFACYSWLLGSAPTPLVATYAYVNPLVAVALGNVLAHEPVNAHILLSTVMIVGAIILINMSRWRFLRGRLREGGSLESE
jgi:drug/metabolite transporter (DMT)-like permease